MNSVYPTIVVAKPVTHSWGPHLVRMLNIVDILARWNAKVVEYLYLATNGQVDKPFPAVGDILAVYLLEGRLFKASPQGWFIITAKQFKASDIKKQPYFWCQAQFHPDIPPVPDFASPWEGVCDQTEVRRRLIGRSIWVRLCATEIDGCSYYNLSDWIKTKRSLYDDKAVRKSTSPQVKLLSPTRLTPTVRKRRRPRTSSSSEYIMAISESSSSTESEAEELLSPRLALSACPPLFAMTTGKMSHGSSLDNTSCSTTASSTANTPRRRTRLTDTTGYAQGVEGALVPVTTVAHTPRYMQHEEWVSLREECQKTILSVLMTKLVTLDAEPWLIDLSHRLETEAVLTKCQRNRDRYVGLSRAVQGILKQFDRLLDSVETLISVDETLRTQLTCNTIDDISPRLGIFFDGPFITI